MADDAVILDRWQKPYSANKANLTRRDLAVKFIPPNSRVLDLGCGAMALRDVLPHGCSYTGVDILPHHPGVVVANLNMMEFPQGEFDVTTLLGVVEYLENPIWTFRKIRERSGKLIFSYEAEYLWTNSAIATCEETCRLNFYRPKELNYILSRTGWTPSAITPFKNKNSKVTNYKRLYVCTKC
jgi:SAM-dependent methyltransferase